MTTMKAKVIVRLKAGVLDPQGQAIEQVLRMMGHSEIKTVRQGKYFELDLATPDSETGRQITESVAREVLSNPVIESFEVQEIG